jgi:hypothetical protein
VRERKRSKDENSSEGDDEILTERELTEGVTERTVAALRQVRPNKLLVYEALSILVYEALSY